MQQSEIVGTATFYSHSFGENFPHAFVLIETRNAYGQIAQDAFGFSARHLSPKILMGTVDGHIAIPSARYVRQSDPHFTLPVTRAQMARIGAIRNRWSAGEGGRYNLNRRNCVHFIGELAEAVGLRTNRDSAHFKEPASFLREVAALNVERFPPGSVPHAEAGR
ncbi:MAG: hypothetical protein WBG08_03610 [Litorimonas sp.]